jgi:hypothetical protein
MRTTQKPSTSDPAALPNDEALALHMLKKKLLVELKYPFPKALRGKTKSWLETEIRLMSPNLPASIDIDPDGHA